MFRKATKDDLDPIAQIYEDIHTEEEAGRTVIGWVRGVYPTRKSAEAALAADELFVEEDGGRVVAAGRINKEQMPAYAEAAWTVKAPAGEVMVLHVLVVSPDAYGRGYGSGFVRFYEQYALEQGCRYLRIDTNERNAAARRLYGRLGYREVSVIPCDFNGISSIRLVCLEKNL